MNATFTKSSLLSGLKSRSKTAQNRLTLERRHSLLAAAVILLSSIIAIQNSSDYSHTSDEPVHIAAGLELLTTGQYTLELQHPPVARLGAAILPWLYGYAYIDGNDIWDAGKNTLYQGDHSDLLQKSRFGMLPFLWVLLIYTYLWAGKLAGKSYGLLALGLVASCPVILAHGGLATLDIAAAGFMLAALYYFSKMLREPSNKNLTFFALFNALAICTKFSAIPFLSATYILAIITWAIFNKDMLVPAIRFLSIPRILLVATVFTMTLWACYGFSVISLAEGVDNFDRKFAKAAEDISFVDKYSAALNWISHKQLPAFLVSIPAGMIHVAHHNTTGHLSFLLGETRTHGWWYFYFVAFFFKSPWTFIILGGLAIFAWIKKRAFSLDFNETDLPVLSIIAIWGFVSFASNINIGVRHILVAYPLVAIASVITLRQILSQKQPWVVGVTWIAIIAYTSLLPIRHSGELLSYFNVMAKPTPEKILINSDYEWGQDLNELSRKIQELGIDKISIGIAMSFATDFNASLEAKHQILHLTEPVQGWIATSKYWQVQNGIDMSNCLSQKYIAGKTIEIYWSEEPLSLLRCLADNP